MSGNLGHTSLRRKRRTRDPMATFDSLPPPLRLWLSQAALPWSPVSAQRIWRRSMAKGLTPQQALMTLTSAEARMLARDTAANLGGPSA